MLEILGYIRLTSRNLDKNSDNVHTKAPYAFFCRPKPEKYLIEHVRKVSTPSL
jgi:hypothetical protein